MYSEILNCWFVRFQTHQKLKNATRNFQSLTITLFEMNSRTVTWHHADEIKANSDATSEITTMPANIHTDQFQNSPVSHQTESAISNFRIFEFSLFEFLNF